MSPNDDAMGHAFHRRPVSCYFCRSRKLRCSREPPCSNCTSRGITCQLYGPRELGVKNKSRDRDVSGRSDPEILARLSRLEDLVTGKTVNPSVEAVGSSAPARIDVQTPAQHRWQPPTTNDPQWIEQQFMDQKSMESIRPDGILFKTCPIRKISKYASYIHQSPTSPSSPGEVIKCIWLPEYEEAKALLMKYLSDITYVHHVIHTSTVKKLIDNLYDDLRRQVSPSPGNVALLLSIVASATYSWNARDTDKHFPTVDEANNQCPSWIKAAMDVLEYSRRTSGTLEDIQAMIILSFLVTNLEGISPRYRSLLSMAIMLGRELLLHRIDHHSNSGSEAIPPLDSISAEIGRRVWWYLTATDWMLSGYAGSHEGVYTVNPRHMAVKKPINANDEDLFDGMENVVRPLSQPTSMSYFIQRIRLAELSREVADNNAPLSSSSPDPLIHSQVMAIDDKFAGFIKEIPSFFRLGGGSVEEIAVVADAGRAPGIIIQRYILNSLVYAHRCKLHVSYLKRGSTDPVYARSREICLHAARMVIRGERLLENEDLPFVLTRLKFSGILYCVAMALIVLLLDVCFNKNEPDYEMKKVEVADAFEILHAATEHSMIAARLVKALLGVLTKYQLSLESINSSPTATSKPTIPHQPDPTTESSTWGIETQDIDGETPGHGIWQTLGVEMDIDNLDWNSFLADLDSQLM